MRLILKFWCQMMRGELLQYYEKKKIIKSYNYLIKQYF